MCHHGWPLSSYDWDAQMLFFVRAMMVNDKGRYRQHLASARNSE